MNLDERVSKLKTLLDNSYIGSIEDIDDPDKVGRTKIKVYGVYGDKNDDLGKIPVDDLPWAYPYYDVAFGSKDGSGSFSTPRKGTIVRVVFDPDQYHPRYFSIEELDEELKDAISKDYENFQSIRWDKDNKLRIYYAKKTGLLLYLDESIINFKPDNSILIDHKQSTSTIELKGNDIDIVTKNSVNVSTPNTVNINTDTFNANGDKVNVGSNSIYSSCNTEILLILCSMLATGLDKKYPPTPGQFAAVVKQMESLILSKNVKVSP